MEIINKAAAINGRQPSGLGLIFTSVVA